MTLPIIGELNKKQIREIAKFNFDLARLSAALCFIHPSETIRDPLIAFMKVIAGLITALVFMYIGLLLLKQKEKQQ